MAKMATILIINKLEKMVTFYFCFNKSIFGGTIAKKIISSIEDGFLPVNTTILEIGAHHGYLLADIIQFIYTLNPKLLESLNFAIVERFENLQEQQIKYIYESFGDIIKLKHYHDIRDVKLENAYVLANEIFDAFGCDLVYTNKRIFYNKHLYQITK